MYMKCHGTLKAMENGTHCVYDNKLASIYSEFVFTVLYSGLHGIQAKIYVSQSFSEQAIKPFSSHSLCVQTVKSANFTPVPLPVLSFI
jgi:hypothetical protein